MGESDEKMRGSMVIPSLRYRDAHQAIEFLVRALGFTKRAVYDGPGGTVAHAQLTLGSGMVMLSSATSEGEWGKRMVQPDEIGGRVTSAPYVVVLDAAAAYATAKAAGAEIVSELTAMDYGGKAFACRDLEGHLWSVGEYDPWA